jgi:hypothetical protein
VQCTRQQPARKSTPAPGGTDTDLEHFGPAVLNERQDPSDNLIAIPGHLPEGRIVFRLAQLGHVRGRV